MEFTLHYRGPLKSKASRKVKHALRQHFHAQLKKLWKQEPLARSDLNAFVMAPSAGASTICIEDDLSFVVLVNAKNQMVAELEVLLIRPEKPGTIVANGGDIDNRLKTLLDALRMPSKSELPKDFRTTTDSPLYCLLEDDRLITRVDVRTAQLLEPISDQTEVILVINVATKFIDLTYLNIGL